MKATRFGKNGSICDGTSGDSTQLIFIRSRWYNPANGRFQSRDTWNGDMNRPLSLNRWMYVEGNPVNMLDPTGKSPNPLASNGYAEGLAVTTAGVFAIATITGTEIVYDFATMQSAVFNITGRKDPATEIVDTPTGWCTSFFGVTTSPYITPIIVGFDYDSDISQYQGNVKSKQLGVDVLGLFGVTALADVALSLGGGGVVFSHYRKSHYCKLVYFYGTLCRLLPDMD